jgi:hypothetical protein
MLSLDCDPPVCASCVAEMTGVPHLAQPLVKMGILPGLALNCSPPDLHLPSSWDYRYEPPYLIPNYFFQFLISLFTFKVTSLAN